MEKKLKLILFILLCCVAIEQSFSQSYTFRTDTLELNLDSVESRFVSHNLMLLAQRYNVDAQKALVAQARLFPNPTLNFNTVAYQKAIRQFFPFGASGEISGGVSQLILMAGKHSKQLKIALANASVSEYQFFDLVRSLKYSLQTDFYSIYYLQKSADVYLVQIASLKKVCDAFEQQKGKGYISEKEVVRVKAQLYSLQSDYNDLLTRINDLQSEIRLLTGDRQIYLKPLVDDAKIAKIQPAKYPLNVVVDSAYNFRPDLKIAKLNTDLSKLNYSLQKSMAVPDVTLQLGYDQQGSYINNMTTVGFSMDLPFLNRNQGNIKSAKSMIKYNEITYESSKAAVEEQIYTTLQKAIQNDKLLNARDVSFEADFSRLMNEVLKNYQSRNISLLDFLDFYDSYRQNTLQINAIKQNRISAFVDLNFYTGIDYLKN